MLTAVFRQSQWWRLTRDPNDATTPSVLEFLAPIGTPFV